MAFDPDQWLGSEKPLTATLLNQETGAYVRGFEAYKDVELRHQIRIRKLIEMLGQCALAASG